MTSKHERKQRLADLWMTATGSLVRCRRVERLGNRLRFQVAGDIQLNEGDHCELLSHRSGESAPAGMGVPFNRGATICRLEESDDGGTRTLTIEAILGERPDHDGPCLRARRGSAVIRGDVGQSVKTRDPERLRNWLASASISGR